MRNRSRLQSAKQYVADRKRKPLCPGDTVYRKGQPCIIVLIGHNTSPPHAVVRTADGREVGVELDHLKRDPNTPWKVPAPPPEDCAPAVPAETCSFMEESGAENAAAQSLISEESQSAVERRAALARLRQRRADRALEDAQQRDEAIANLLEGKDAGGSQPAAVLLAPRPPSVPRRPASPQRFQPASHGLAAVRPPTAVDCGVAVAPSVAPLPPKGSSPRVALRKLRTADTQEQSDAQDQLELVSNGRPTEVPATLAAELPAQSVYADVETSSSARHAAHSTTWTRHGSPVAASTCDGRFEDSAQLEVSQDLLPTAEQALVCVQEGTGPVVQTHDVSFNDADSRCGIQLRADGGSVVSASPEEAIDEAHSDGRNGEGVAPECLAREAPASVSDGAASQALAATPEPANAVEAAIAPSCLQFDEWNEEVRQQHAGEGSSESAAADQKTEASTEEPDTVQRAKQRAMNRDAARHVVQHCMRAAATANDHSAAYLSVAADADAAAERELHGEMPELSREEHSVAQQAVLVEEPCAESLESISRETDELRAVSAPTSVGSGGCEQDTDAVGGWNDESRIADAKPEPVAASCESATPAAVTCQQECRAETESEPLLQKEHSDHTDAVREQCRAETESEPLQQKEHSDHTDAVREQCRAETESEPLRQKEHSDHTDAAREQRRAETEPARPPPEWRSDQIGEKHAATLEPPDGDGSQVDRCLTRQADVDMQYAGDESIRSEVPSEATLEAAVTHSAESKSSLTPNHDMVARLEEARQLLEKERLRLEQEHVLERQRLLEERKAFEEERRAFEEARARHAEDQCRSVHDTSQAASAADARTCAEGEPPGSGPSQSEVDVLLCLDASYAMHAPLSLASKSFDSWDEADWDALGHHLRKREEPCRLEPMGMRALHTLARGLWGLSVQVMFGGGSSGSRATVEDYRAQVSASHSDPFDADGLSRLWKRCLHPGNGASLWRQAADTAANLGPRGLKTVVVVTGSVASELQEQDFNFGVPVHVCAVGTPQAAVIGGRVSHRTGGHCLSLRSEDWAEREFAGMLTHLLSLPRSLPVVPEPQPVLCLDSAARVVQRAVRRYLRRLQDQRRRAAAIRIAGAYGRYRLLSCVYAAALESRRARKRGPVQAALERRRAVKQQASAEAAARRIQSEWRARRVRHWCQRIDRAARRLQMWFRQRRLAHRLVKEAERLRARKLRQVDLPPAPPLYSERHAGLCTSAPAGLSSCTSKGNLAFDNTGVAAREIPMPMVPMGMMRVVAGGALPAAWALRDATDKSLMHASVGSCRGPALACPPPLKKPHRPGEAAGPMRARASHQSQEVGVPSARSASAGAAAAGLRSAMGVSPRLPLAAPPMGTPRGMGVPRRPLPFLRQAQATT